LQYTITHWGTILVIFHFCWWGNDGVPIFPLYFRRRQLPPKAILARHRGDRNNCHYWDDRAMLLNLSFLEDVGHFCFHLKICCSTHTLMLRTQNIYVTSVLNLLMLASVCPSNSWFEMRANSNFSVSGLFGNGNKSCHVYGICPTGQAGVVCYVRTVPLLSISSNGVSCLKYMVWHECGFKCRHCPGTSLAIASHQVTLQSYPRVFHTIVDNWPWSDPRHPRVV
jgi:hypothetical protein